MGLGVGLGLGLGVGLGLANAVATMEMSTRDDGKRGLAPTAPKAGRSAGATAEWKAPPTA